MKLQQQPNRWSCMPTALAMLLDRPVEMIINQIGHDGSDKIWPDKPEPNCYRGFNIQELIRVADSYGYALTPIYSEVIIDNTSQRDFRELGRYIREGDLRREELEELYQKLEASILTQSNEKALTYYMSRGNGLLIGLGSSGSPHAVAWDYLTEGVFDPCGQILSMYQFTIHEFWMVQILHRR